MKKKSIGLALGGGGAKGLSHIEFIKALDEMELKPSIIAGSSIGAFIGGFYAAGVSGIEMEHILRKAKFSNISRLVDLTIRRTTSMLKGKGVENFLLKNMPASRFEDLQIPIKVVATDFWQREEVIFESGNLIQAIRASMALPVIFKPLNFNHKVLIDGNMVNPLPYDIIRSECDILIAIDVSGTKIPQHDDPMPNLFESIMSSLQIMQASIVKNKMKISRPDIYIKPALKNIRILHFDRYDEIKQGVQDDVEQFKHELNRQMKKKRRFFLFC
jgi:NTE family protein